MKWKCRARTDEAKTEKGRIILDTALRLFKKKEYKEITVSMIACHAKIAKGTLFLYFPTKEELFLSLAARQFNSFFQSFNTHISEDNKAPKIDGLISVILKSIEGNEDLIKISPLMNTIIEKNVSAKTLMEFKNKIHSEMIDTGKNIEMKYPSVAPGRGVQVLMWLYGLMIGFKNISDPIDIVCSGVGSKDVSLFNFDFKEQFEQAVRALLSGLLEK
jgi:AcrR family transcriptional regulator